MTNTAHQTSELLPRADETPAKETAVTAKVASHAVKTDAPTADHANDNAATVPKIENVVSQAREIEFDPVSALMKLRDQGADIKKLLLAMNEAFAVAQYGSKIVVVRVIGNDLIFMTDDDFHKMFANLIIFEETKDKNGATKTNAIKLSKRWYASDHRRRYFGRGVVFEPGGPPEIPNDMLNLWRGFGFQPKQGDWSLMRTHIRDVICSGNEEHFQYLIKWMAYGVQHPDRPIGVAVALRGDEGAGKGFLWRNYGKLFGKHFKHVAHGEHLTGRFNAVLAETCAVFLDEALWAGDRKGEQILKALITEDTFQLERKNYDPIPVKNRLRLMIASNNQWIVPVSTKGRRYCVFDVSDKYADQKTPEHTAYWAPLQAQFGDDACDDGRAAMLYDLIHMDLSGLNVRDVPESAAKTEQKLLSLRGTMAWLHQILQEGAIGSETWQNDGLTVSKDHAYMCYEDFSKRQHDWRPEIKPVWSKNIHAVLGPNVKDKRLTKDNRRVYSFQFAPLTDCWDQFAKYLGAPDLKREEPDGEPGSTPCVAVGQTVEGVGGPTEQDALQDAPSIEWEPELEPELDDRSEYEPEHGLESD